MSKHISSRCQLLSILVERRPSGSDSISDFGRLLLSSEPSILYTPLLLIFRVVCHQSQFFVILVAENFRLSWVNSESFFSVLRLNSHCIFWSC